MVKTHFPQEVVYGVIWGEKRGAGELERNGIVILGYIDL